jgi:hypothetical protein
MCNVVEGNGPEPVGDLALLLVGLDEHARVAHEMRVPLAQDDLHRLCIDEGDEAEHALLLVRDAHVLHWSVQAARSQPKPHHDQSIPSTGLVRGSPNRADPNNCGVPGT